MEFFQIMSALAVGKVFIPDNGNIVSDSTLDAFSNYEHFDDFAQSGYSTPAGQTFSDWVVRTASELLQDACVRNNNTLGVVITSQVRHYDIELLARHLAEGFQNNFPQRNLKVLVYALDKRLTLTVSYNNQTYRFDYQ